MRRWLLVLAVVALFLIATPVLMVIAIISGSGSSTTAASCDANAGNVASSAVQLAGLDAEQQTNAGIIIAEGRAMGVPDQGIIVALATSRQEEDLHNDLVPNNLDSVGLFQQRPSQGWGTAAQVGDPHYSSRKFYSALLAVPGWAGMAVTDAAQRVQRSGTPGAYAKWEGLARTILGAAGGTVSALVPAACVSTVGNWAGSDPGPGPQGVDHLVPRMVALRAAVRQQFPEFTDIGCWRASDPFPDHPSGRACDFMVPGGGFNAAGNASGDKLADWVNVNAAALGVQYEIWQQRYRAAGLEYTPMADRGGWTANHRDHVHVTVLP